MGSMNLEFPPLSESTWLRLIANALDPDAPPADAGLIPDPAPAIPTDEAAMDADLFGEDPDDDAALTDLDDLADAEDFSAGHESFYGPGDGLPPEHPAPDDDTDDWLA